MDIRNVAIIAHVDHGKTTLVDVILRQTGTFRANERVIERVMDSNDLERERGITILAKNTAVFYKDYKINIVDTPGHSDFGGEVERIISMVDGALLVVDAFEGPMPQTRFVLQKALQAGLQPIVVINKIDRPDQRSQEVLNEVFDLFIELGADEKQLDFPVVYCSARTGLADVNMNRAIARAADGESDILPLLDEIIQHVRAPGGNPEGSLSLLVSNLDYDDYVGRICIGRIREGSVKAAQIVSLTHGSADILKTAKVVGLYAFQGLKRVPVDSASAGEIVALTGLEDGQIGDTITVPDDPQFLPPIEVDEPTLTMVFGVNDSPFAGLDGKYLTSRHVRDRLFKEQRTNVSLRVKETESPDRFEVSGRGELHLSILIENMRREGYELSVGKPKVIMKKTDEGLLEPLEFLTVDVPSQYLGTVMERLGARRAEMKNMVHFADGRVRVDFTVPARGLVGFNSPFMTDTNGKGVMYYTFYGYGPYRGDVPGRLNGVIVAWERGTVTAYAIANAQERSELFVSPGDDVYEGMIVGENAREYDMDFNICKKKHLTNMRSSTSDIATKIDPPRRMTLEDALAYIAEDELVEVTPKGIRMRKKILDRGSRHDSRP